MRDGGERERRVREVWKEGEEEGRADGRDGGEREGRGGRLSVLIRNPALIMIILNITLAVMMKIW